eukprot:TRINITY_DN1924_c0_g1_i2.p1 TRINITY_DN1924_c0_g1~~TRINITY_DN1924_c0_g1_i2.p1  ORF type:complete len:425 (-),score=131.69 TRINITY_DN1924_c0_g1_i2:162-1436(-)
MADPSAVPPTTAPDADAAAGDDHRAGATPEDGLCFETSDLQTYVSFDDMSLERSLLRGIYSFGFERPSAIQQRAIVPVTKGGDVIAQAPSGTGKTGAFSVGLLQRIDPALNATQALVLSPVRELAIQSTHVIASLGRFQVTGDKKLVACFIGGTNVREDQKAASSGIPVAVGTPGRVIDLIQRGALRVEQLRILVLDEADEMLSRGFEEQIKDLFRYVPKDVQVVLFSATMPGVVLDLTKKFMREPLSILVKREQLTLEGIKQFYVSVEEKYKLETLRDLYKVASVAQSVIFCNNKRKVDWLAKKMEDSGHQVSSVHADMERDVRLQVMESFKSGRTRMLITTDLLARGIDVQHVSVVINYDLPRDKEQYLHRIGRGGRYGRKGVAINFVTPEDVTEFREIEEFYSTKIGPLRECFACVVRCGG